MKFGPLINYDLRNIFLETSCTECRGETIRRAFFKKSKLSISLDVSILKFNTFFFIVCQVEDYRNWLKLSCRPLAFTSNKAFLKRKRRSGTSLPASFSAWFFKENISLVIFFYLTKFQCLVAFTSWDIGQYVYCNSLLTRLWRNKFWN